MMALLSDVITMEVPTASYQLNYLLVDRDRTRRLLFFEALHQGVAAMKRCHTSAQ